MKRLPKVTPTPIPAFSPMLSPVRGRDVPVGCSKTVDEVVWATVGAVEVSEEENCSADDGMIEGVTVTVAGPVAVTVISLAYVVGRPFVDEIVRLGPSMP